MAELLSNKAKDAVNKSRSISELLAIASASVSAAGDEDSQCEDDDSGSSDAGSSSLEESEGDVRASIFGNPSTLTKENPRLQHPKKAPVQTRQGARNG